MLLNRSDTYVGAIGLVHGDGLVGIVSPYRFDANKLLPTCPYCKGRGYIKACQLTLHREIHSMIRPESLPPPLDQSD